MQIFHQEQKLISVGSPMPYAGRIVAFGGTVLGLSCLTSFVAATKSLIKDVTLTSVISFISAIYFSAKEVAIDLVFKLRQCISLF